MGDPAKPGAVWNAVDKTTGQPYTWSSKYYYNGTLPPPPATTTKRMKFRLSLGFQTMKDTDLEIFTTNVIVQLTKNATLFPNLPVAVVALTTQQNDFHLALAATEDGGKHATREKNDKRLILEDSLRAIALYIQGIVGMTPANAELSGYKVLVAGPHNPLTLVTPAIIEIFNVAPGKIGFKIQSSPGASGYEIYATTGGLAPVMVCSSTSSRNLVAENLKPGTLYAFQVRALGGSTGHSELSDPMSHICT